MLPGVEISVYGTCEQVLVKVPEKTWWGGGAEGRGRKGRERAAEGKGVNEREWGLGKAPKEGGGIRLEAFSVFPVYQILNTQSEVSEVTDMGLVYVFFPTLGQ